MTMPSVPPPLPVRSAHPLPPPLPVGYRSAPVVASGLIAGRAVAGWATVASLATASQWHVACAALSRQGILSRVNPDAPDSAAMELQVMATEAEWATEILREAIPQIAGMAAPAREIPVALAPASEQSAGPPTPAIPAMPLASLQKAAPAGPGYYVSMTFLWILLIGIVLFILLVVVVY